MRGYVIYVLIISAAFALLQFVAAALVPEEHELLVGIGGLALVALVTSTLLATRRTRRK